MRKSILIFVSDTGSAILQPCLLRVMLLTRFQTDSIWYPQSEACLTLNVIRGSSTTSNSKLPVGVWIHGGGFYMGSGADQRYNMSEIVDNSYNIGITP